jgi:hypothetical protein
MPHFTGCRVVAAFDDARPDCEDGDAELQLGDGALLLTYWDDDGVVVLSGAERAPGEYDWTARSRPRRGTLRRVDARTLTGTWEQGDDCGTLRIELSDAREEI